MDNSQTLTHVSLCAGYGGIDLGLKRALEAVRTIAFSEIEAYAVENLVKKMEQGHLEPAPIWTDLKTFPWASFRGKVDILSGGFPCQPFSAAGRRAGDSDPRHLWPYITTGIRELGRPPLIFLENVEGILSSKLSGEGWSDPAGTPVLLHILRELERLGYNATAGIFSAREIGAPHQRKRVFILGTNLNSEGRDIVNGLLHMGHAEGGRVWHDRENDGPPYRKEHAPNDASLFSLTADNMADTEGNRDRRVGGTTQRASFETIGKEQGAIAHSRCQNGATAYPAPRGAAQHPWEPPRTTTDGDGQQITNRTDELRLLGNGVVPDTAARAFRGLWESLVNTSSTREQRHTHRQAKPPLG